MYNSVKPYKTSIFAVILIGLFAFGIFTFIPRDKIALTDQQAEFSSYTLPSDEDDYLDLSMPEVSIEGDIAYVKKYDLSVPFASTVIDDRTLYLISYQVEWSVSNVTIVENSEILWEATIGGYSVSTQFIDLNNDGIDEIEVETDGGGNSPACVNIYYRWTGELYEAIKFIDDDGDLDAANCGGLIDVDNDGAFEYRMFFWRHMYPEIYSQYLGIIRDAPKEVLLCENVMRMYRYDGTNFVTTDEEVVEDNVDGTKYMRTCLGY